MAVPAADEATQDNQSTSQPPPKPASPNGIPGFAADSQATSSALVLPGVPSGHASSMPPPADSNQAKYRSVILGLTPSLRELTDQGCERYCKPTMQTDIMWINCSKIHHYSLLQVSTI